MPTPKSQHKLQNKTKKRSPSFSLFSGAPPIEMRGVSTGRIKKKTPSSRRKSKMIPALIEEGVNSMRPAPSDQCENAIVPYIPDDVKSQSWIGRLQSKIMQLLNWRSEDPRPSDIFESEEEIAKRNKKPNKEVESHDPLQKIALSIRKLPNHYIIGEFGTVEGDLRELVKQQVCFVEWLDNNAPHQPDLTALKNEALDVVVYCLTLKGNNLMPCMLEANRVLRKSGIVYIAELRSRYDSIQQFIRGTETCGFKLIEKDVSGNLFLYFTFQKEQNVERGSSDVLAFTLKPCAYRMRASK